MTPTFRVYKIEEWCKENKISFEELENLLNLLNIDSDYEHISEWKDFENLLKSIPNWIYADCNYTKIRNVVVFKKEELVKIFFDDEDKILTKLKQIYNMRSFL